MNAKHHHQNNVEEENGESNMRYKQEVNKEPMQVRRCKIATKCSTFLQGRYALTNHDNDNKSSYDTKAVNLMRIQEAVIQNENNTIQEDYDNPSSEDESALDMSQIEDESASDMDTHTP